MSIGPKWFYINEAKETIDSSVSRISIIKDTSEKIVDLTPTKKDPITTTLMKLGKDGDGIKASKIKVYKRWGVKTICEEKEEFDD